MLSPALSWFVTSYITGQEALRTVLQMKALHHLIISTSCSKLIKIQIQNNFVSFDCTDELINNIGFSYSTNKYCHASSRLMLKDSNNIDFNSLWWFYSSVSAAHTNDEECGEIRCVAHSFSRMKWSFLYTDVLRAISHSGLPVFNSVGYFSNLKSLGLTAIM